MTNSATTSDGKRTRRRAVTLLLLLGLPATGLAGCSQQDDTTDASSSASPSAAVTTTDSTTGAGGPAEATQAWLDAYSDGDGPAVCALQTPAFSRSEIAKFGSDEVTTCEQSVAAVVEIFELAVADGDIESIDAVLGGATAEVLDEAEDTARVMVELVGEEPSEYELSRVDGRWLISAEINAEG